MSFTPVALVSPAGDDYTALDPIDLNDRVAQGYKRVPEKTLAPSPTPRQSYGTVGDYVASRTADTDSE